MKPLGKLKITNAAGEKIDFSSGKVAASLHRAGANESITNEVVDRISSELYEGITTREIYNRAFHLLKKKNPGLASRYKLKKAIYELGPTGYPFENFIAAILLNSGYEVQVGKIVQGHCVSHEVDVIAKKNGKTILIECKFHSEQGRYCNVKIPLYIHARYNDIQNGNAQTSKDHFQEGWVVTNTRFTKDAEQYADCVGLHLLSWDKPRRSSLKDRIDHLGLYPITVSSILSQREKQFLLSREVVLCKDLIDYNFYLDHLNVSESRKGRILKEMKALCALKQEK